MLRLPKWCRSRNSSLNRSDSSDGYGTAALSDKKDMHFSTRAIHVPGIRRDGAIAPPIHLSTTFEHGPANEAISQHEYVRSGNPNVDELEARLASLENGVAALTFSSGMAASNALLGSLPPGSEILLHKDTYYDTRTIAKEFMEPLGIRHRVLDLRDSAAVDAALTDNTSMVWLESPSNPRLDIIDIAAMAARAHEAGAKLTVDSTFATPAVQQPLELGADYVMHSMTKFMGGHSDIMGGALIFRDDADLAERLRYRRTLSGAVLSPFNAWLISRGLQTLDCRLERHSANALRIATLLDAHPAVARTNFPFLESAPARDLAKRQMRMGGGMLSFEMKGGRDAAIRVASRVRLFVNATSLGGVESLIEHRASIEGPYSASPDNLLRVSVGLEHPDDLAADLEAALA
jgi:cystathionine gamma-synthase